MKNHKDGQGFKSTEATCDAICIFIKPVLRLTLLKFSVIEKMSELKDCPPLKYYDFKPVEHVKVCPRYTAVLGRSEDDGIGIEELDTLQLELETLLSSASRRLRALEEQRQVRSLYYNPFLLFVVFSLSLSLSLDQHMTACPLFPTDPHRLAGQKRRQKVSEGREGSRSGRVLSPSQA